MRYDTAFHLNLLMLALQKSNLNAASHYCVNENQVREWKNKVCLLKEMPNEVNATIKVCI